MIKVTFEDVEKAKRIVISPSYDVRLVLVMDVAQAIADERERTIQKGAEVLSSWQGAMKPEEVQRLLENLRERSVRLLKDKCFCIAGGTCPPCAEAEEIRALPLEEK